MKTIASLVIAVTLALQGAAHANPAAVAVGKWLLQQIAANMFSDLYESATGKPDPRAIQARLEAAEAAFSQAASELAANDAALAGTYRQLAGEISALRREVNERTSRERIEEVVKGVLGKLEQRIGAAEVRVAGVEFRVREIENLFGCLPTVAPAPLLATAAAEADGRPVIHPLTAEYARLLVRSETGRLAIAKMRQTRRDNDPDLAALLRQDQATLAAVADLNRRVNTALAAMLPEREKLLETLKPAHESVRELDARMASVFWLCGITRPVAAGPEKGRLMVPLDLLGPRCSDILIAFKLSKVEDREMVPLFRKLADAGVVIESQPTAVVVALPETLAAHAVAAAKLAETCDNLAQNAVRTQGELARAMSALSPAHPEVQALRQRKSHLLAEAAALQTAADRFLDLALADFVEAVRTTLRPTTPVMREFHAGSVLPVAGIAALCAGAGADNATLREDCWKRLLEEDGLAGRVAGDAREFDLGGGVKLVAKWVPGGKFLMGSPATEEDREDDETRHEVTLTSPYWMGETEVTQAQWEAMMGDNPSQFRGERLPVERVSWDEANEFVKKLNQKALLPRGWRWTLPSEAQWERACRGGTGTVFHYGDSLSSTQANFNGDYPYGGAAKGPNLNKTAPVKSYAPNAYGLYDMHGNVWEWCADWYGEYSSGAATDPQGALSGPGRVLRGGGWGDSGGFCRAAYRSGGSPRGRYCSLGFRVAAVPAER